MSFFKKSVFFLVAGLSASANWAGADPLPPVYIRQYRDIESGKATVTLAGAEGPAQALYEIVVANTPASGLDSRPASRGSYNFFYFIFESTTVGEGKPVYSLRALFRPGDRTSPLLKIPEGMTQEDLAKLGEFLTDELGAVVRGFRYTNEESGLETLAEGIDLYFVACDPKSRIPGYENTPVCNFEHQFRQGFSRR